MSTLIILDTPISLEKEFKVALKNIFGFSYIKLRHLNKVFGVNTRSNYKIKDLKKQISLEQDKFFSIKCYRRNRLLLGLPAHGQRTHTNAKTSKKLRIKY